MTLLDLLGIEKVEDRLFLVDGHAALFRSFYAIPALSTRQGQPVNALYGFVRTLVAAVRSFPSKYVAVALDAPGKTVRHEAYPQYKATRKPMPETLAQQLAQVKPLLEALGVPGVESMGYEADDVMATLSWMAGEQGIPAYNLTGDKDMAQLVSERVFLVRPGRRPTDRFEVLDRPAVEREYGAPPERLVDLLALEGDAVDNVPGVRGVGGKTAAELIRRFGSLEEVLAQAERIPNRRVAEALKTQAEDALLSRELVRLRRAPLGLTLADCQPRPVELEKLRQLLEELEFRTILAELKLPESGAPQARRSSTFEVIVTEEGLRALVEKIKSQEEFSLDLETTSTDPLSAEIVGLALAWEPGHGVYIPVGHAYLGAPKQLALSKVLAQLRPLLEAQRPRKIGQNLKYDLQVLANYGVAVRGVVFDAMVAHWLLRPDTPSHALDVIAREELGVQMQSYQELLEKDGVTEMVQVQVEQAARYSAEDAAVVCRLRPILTQRLKENELLELYEEVETPLIEVLRCMERRGVLLDVDVLREQGKELEIQLGELRRELEILAGGPINPNSTPQVREVLYGRLKLPVLEKTKTGPSTDAAVLRELAAHHEFPAKLLAYRELEKLRNTYIVKLPEYVHPKTGRVHTSWNQTATATGRLSSSEPNLQAIPLKTGGVDIRRAFIAPPGKVLLGADYSQIELRILAHLSGDENLREAFRRGEDLHRRTAVAIFGVAPEQVDARMRTVAKRVNFGIIYGISPYGLSRDLGIPQKDAKVFIDRFFQAYPKVGPLVENLVEEAQRTGYARTMLGRRRPLPGLASKDRAGYSADRRNAINTPIQGSAADLLKRAMLSLYEEWKAGHLPAEMILTVHDELVFEVEEAEAAKVGQQVRAIMESVWELAVPLKVDVKIGRTWGDL